MRITDVQEIYHELGEIEVLTLRLMQELREAQLPFTAEQALVIADKLRGLQQFIRDA